MTTIATNLTGTNRKWANISKDFTDDLVKEWKDNGFTYETCNNWININHSEERDLEIHNVAWYVWIKDIKKKTPEWILNFGNLAKLQEEYDYFVANYKGISDYWAKLSDNVKKLDAKTGRSAEEDAELAYLKAEQADMDDIYGFTTASSYYSGFSSGSGPKPKTYDLEKEQKPTILRVPKDKKAFNNMTNEDHVRNLIPFDFNQPESYVLDDWGDKSGGKQLGVFSEKEIKAIKKYLTANQKQLRDLGWYPQINHAPDRPYTENEIDDITTRRYTLEQLKLIGKNILMLEAKEEYIDGIRKGKIITKIPQEFTFPYFKYTYLTNPTYYYNKTANIFGDRPLITHPVPPKSKTTSSSSSSS